jgi:hypothetical protein
VTRRLWLAIGFLAASIAPAWAQAPDGRIPTVSRLVVLFTQQELQLAERIKARDSSGVGALLTDDFELRASSQPGQPVPRADWIDQSLKSPAPAGAPRDMAVHDLGNAALVSFRQPFGSAKSSMFVVDLWRRGGDDWKLAVRYAAPAGSDSVSMPGVPRATPQIPKKY